VRQFYLQKLNYLLLKILNEEEVIKNPANYSDNVKVKCERIIF
jgi:hypothetical protein